MKLLRAICTFVLHVAWVRGLDVGDLFDVDQATCGSLLSSGTLQDWVNESLEIAEAAQTMFNIAKDNQQESPPVAKAYIQGWLSLDPSAGGFDAGTAETVLNSVVNFLQTGDVPNRGTRAWLFCSDSGFMKVSPNSPALRKDGSTQQTNSQGQVLTVKQAYPEEFNSAIYRTIPYWIPSANQYLFQQVLPFNVFAATQKFCTYAAGETFLEDQNAANQQEDDQAQTIILLCPNTPLPIYSIQQTSLGSRAPNPVRPGRPPLQSIELLLPKSNTLIHELFHYCPYPGVSTGDPAYFAGGCQRLSSNKAVNNAQSYCYLGIGAWYTQNERYNGKTVSYASGGCTYVL